jgi:long-chain fatty acid transport protein
MYWNPATSAVLNDALEFGVELLNPHTTLASSIPADALGPGLPPVSLSGSDRGDNGAFALPSAAVLYTPDGSWLTYGVGLFAVAGIGVNYAASPSNPILTPPPPTGLGLGALFSELQVVQITPSLAARISDRLSIGVGPTVNLALVRVNPMFFGSPDDANGDGFFSYPDGGAHTRTVWGEDSRRAFILPPMNSGASAPRSKARNGSSGCLSIRSMNSLGPATTPSGSSCH